MGYGEVFFVVDGIGMVYVGEVGDGWYEVFVDVFYCLGIWCI